LNQKKGAAKKVVTARIKRIGGEVVGESRDGRTWRSAAERVGWRARNAFFIEWA